MHIKKTKQKKQYPASPQLARTLDPQLGVNEWAAWVQWLPGLHGNDDSDPSQIKQLTRPLYTTQSEGNKKKKALLKTKKETMPKKKLFSSHLL